MSKRKRSPFPRSRTRNQENTAGISPTIAAVDEIIDARQRLGWTQSELARRAGVSQTTVAEIERRHRPGSPATMRKLTLALRGHPRGRIPVPLMTGEEMADARKRLGWSQRELARQAGVSYEIVSRIERERACRLVAARRKLAEFLGRHAEKMTPVPIMTADEIIDARQRLGWTRGELARRAGVSTVYHVETRSSLGAPATMRKLTLALHRHRRDSTPVPIMTREEIVEARRRLGWTRRELARRARVSHSTLREIERRSGSRTPAIMRRLTLALNGLPVDKPTGKRRKLGESGVTV